MQKRVENAINVLLDALNNKTLVKGDMCGCAVGNLVANSLGLHLKCEVIDEDSEMKETKVRSKEGIYNGEWFNMDYDLKNNCTINKNSDQAYCTEFTPDELYHIERAFEGNTRLYNLGDYTPEELRQDQINGLEAVVKVMLSFDDSKEDVKQVFTNKADLIPV